MNTLAPRFPDWIKTQAPTLPLVALLIVVYVVTARIGLTYAVVGNTVTLVWAPSGIALVALLRWGARLAPGVFLGAWLANLASGLPLGPAALIAIGNMGEAIAGYAMLSRFIHFRLDLARRRDIFALLICAGCLATVVAATLGSGALMLAGSTAIEDYAGVWLKWWLGDMLGILVIAPFLLVVLKHPLPRPSPVLVAEAIALLIVVIAFSYSIFGEPELAGQGYYPAALGVFPFLIWGALRFDHWGSVTVTLLVSTIAIWGTANGTGPFVVASPVDSLVGWCAFANTLGVTGLLLAALRAEQRRDHIALTMAHDELECRVKERTNELLQAYIRLKQSMEQRAELERNLVQVSESQQKRLGQELHDGLGQHLTSLSFLVAALAEQLRQQGLKAAEQAERIERLIQEAITTTRQIARGLYPVSLEEQGFVNVLRELLHSTASATGIRCQFEAEVAELQLTPMAVINLYRFAQEAIANSIRHSQATQITIQLVRLDNCLELSICDNGIGIDESELKDPRGIGLTSLRERASLLGGKCEIATTPGDGARIVIRFHEEDHKQ